ncbi:MAG: transposase [Pseudomonadota bacterium]
MPSSDQTRHTGGTFVFTVRTAQRGSDLLLREVDLLRHVTRQTRRRFPFTIDEIVVLGDVIHTIWTLPERDRDYSKRWRMLKTLFSQSCPAPDQTGPMRLRAGENGIWQRRFWEHAILTADDFEAHRQMIFNAPVQAGLVNRPVDWAHSSVHRAIARGTFGTNAPVDRVCVPPRRRAARAPLTEHASAM